MGKKTSRHEKAARCTLVYHWVCSGLSRSDIVQKSAETWKVCTRTADEYLKEARKAQEQDCAMTRQEFMAEALAQYRKLKIRAESNGNLAVAKSCVDAQVQLVGLVK